MSANRYHNYYQDGAVCFWTSSIEHRVPVLRSRTAARALIETMVECRSRCGAKILGYVIMPDHVHIAVWTERAVDTQRFLRQFLGTTSAKLAGMAERAADNGNTTAATWLTVFKKCARDGAKVRVWKERGRAFPVTEARALFEKLAYIHNNPVRLGIAQQPEDWEFSSASWYSHRSGPLDIDSLDW